MNREPPSVISEPPKVPPEIRGEPALPTDQGVSYGPGGKPLPPSVDVIGARYGDDTVAGPPTYVLILFRSSTLDRPLPASTAPGGVREIDGAAMACAPGTSIDAPSVVAQCQWSDGQLTGVLNFMNEMEEDELFAIASQVMQDVRALNATSP